VATHGGHGHEVGAVHVEVSHGIVVPVFTPAVTQNRVLRLVSDVNNPAYVAELEYDLKASLHVGYSHTVATKNGLNMAEAMWMVVYIMSMRLVMTLKGYKCHPCPQIPSAFTFMRRLPLP
jgi:hypothetical protein